MAISAIDCNKVENLVEAWGNYYFHTEEKAFSVEPLFATWLVYENVVDDINELRFSGSLEECVAYCTEQGAYNYDPLAKWR